MTWLIFALLLVPTGALLFDVPSIDCPAACLCITTASLEINVNCESPIFIGNSINNNGMAQLPIEPQSAIDFHMLPHNATKISVYRGSGLQVLPGRSFTPFRTLSTLEIRLSDLQNLDEMSFAGLKTLRVLNLQLNGIRTLPKNVFRQTQWLTELRLDENVIEDLPDGVFAQLRTLRVLDLSKNRLTQLRSGMFEGLGLLQELRLSRNRIVELEAPAFSAMLNLKSLKLPGNQLKRVSGPVFANLSTLSHVDLSSNLLSFADPSVFSAMQSSVKEVLLCNNPWICDCAMLPLKRWIDAVKPQAAAQKRGIAFDKASDVNEPICRSTCRFPTLISGASLVNMREESVYCATTTTTISTSTTTTTTATTEMPSILLGIRLQNQKLINMPANVSVVEKSTVSSSSFDMTVSLAISVAAAGVVLLMIIVSIIVYQVKKCKARRRALQNSANSTLGGSNSVLVHGKQSSLYHTSYANQYLGDVTSGGGSTGSDFVSDSKSDSSAGSPNNFQHSQHGQVPTTVFGLSYNNNCSNEQWTSPNSVQGYYGVNSSSSTTVLGGYPPSLTLNPMPIPSAAEQVSGTYPTAISLGFPPNSSSTPGKPFSFIGGASSHDIMTSSFPPPPPQSAIAILDALHNEHIAQQQQKNNLSSSSRSESLV